MRDDEYDDGEALVKQLAQRIKDGKLRVLDVPPPRVDEWMVLVKTEASLVSAGTERAKVETGRESLLGKARRRPDQVRQVVDKLRTDGLGATVDAVRSRLEAWTPLGYSACGIALEVGARVPNVSPGDRVACGGEGAAHSELLAVPGNLCVRVPPAVDAAAAAFTTVGAIALHGFRQSDVRLGERVAVLGMGLVGQLTARIAHAAGCEVMGIDLDQWRLDVAERAGVLATTRRRDEVADDDFDTCDAVIVTAAAPASGDPAALASDLARERGRIVIVGDVLLEFDRRKLYAKELELRLARSYGPGRYDIEYEQRGLDYPLPFVRWTQTRNMAEFVRLLSERRIDVGDLITHRFSIDEAEDALDAVTRPEERAVGVIIEYGGEQHAGSTTTTPTGEPRAFSAGKAVGFLGAGSFARRYLIPLARENGLSLERVATASGLSATAAAEQFGFTRGAGTVAELLADDALNGIVVATRHQEHAELALAALRAGKAVFVEKPLCLRESELDELAGELRRDGCPPLMVGFNRRFAPLVVELKNHLGGVQGPTNVVVRVNAGRLPADHWLNDPELGGGRLLGEGCHFVDLMLHLVDAAPVTVSAQANADGDEASRSAQNFSVSIRFADGSLGTFVYGTSGAPTLGKEFIEVHRGNRSAQLDDFHTLRMLGDGRTRKERTRRRDKGHALEVRTFAAVVRGESAAPAAETYIRSMAATFAALRSLETGAATPLAVS